MTNQEIKNQILEGALKDVPFDGWSWDVVLAAAKKSEHEANMAHAVFPNKLQDVLIYFSEWVDQQMVEKLQEINIDDMRIRDRVHQGVMTRFEVLEPHKEAVRSALSYWMIPTRKITAGKLMWQAADHIWIWAGDTATDYNHYTKRGLLSGILASTAYIWLNDESENYEKTKAFLDRRINNVLKIGKAAGSVLQYVPFLKKGKA